MNLAKTEKSVCKKTVLCWVVNNAEVDSNLKVSNLRAVTENAEP